MTFHTITKEQAESLLEEGEVTFEGTDSAGQNTGPVTIDIEGYGGNPESDIDEIRTGLQELYRDTGNWEVRFSLSDALQALKKVDDDG